MKRKLLLATAVLWAVCVICQDSSGMSLNEEGQSFAVLKNLSYVKTDQALDVVIEIEGVYVYQVFELSNPLRLAIDFSPVNWILSNLYYEIKEWSLLNIRVGQFHPYIVRVVFDFSDRILPYEIQQLENGLRIILSPEGTKTIKIISPVQEQRPQPEPQKIAPPPAPVPSPMPVREDLLNTMIGISVGSYKISDERFQEVYPGSSAIYGFHLSRVLFSCQDIDFDLSLEAKIFSKTGASTVTLEESKFSITPISIGARCLWNSKYLILFVSIGKDFYSYKETSLLYPSPGYIEGNASGNYFQGGAYFRIPGLDALRVKLYYKSTKVLTTENEIEVNLGGNEYGVCLSYGFNLFKR
ncbi:MAG: AMIN domain-containing protein [Candidatus Aminicenantales bacterium]